jgi:hypothetical protein
MVRPCFTADFTDLELRASYPRLSETVSQYRSWFENLTTNGIARSRIQAVIRSP